jgi:hypothetical protein
MSDHAPWGTYLISGVWSVISGIGAFLAGLFMAHRRRMQAGMDKAVDADSERDKQIAELQRQLSLLTQSVTPISAAFQAILIKQLTHFHTPELDALLTKIGPPVTLTQQEEKQLAKELESRAADLDDSISEDERGAAVMLPFLIKRVRRETEMPLDIKNADALVVSVPKSYE